MSIIEQAAKRLQELRRAGVEIPDVDRLRSKRVEPTLDPVRAPGHPKPEGEGPHPALGATDKGGQTAQSTEPARTSRQIALDFSVLAAGGIVTPDVPRSQTADEFRVVKRPLLSNATGKGAAPITNGNLIMITSALPGEGKSFTSANLAMSIAMELDRTVLLVDADVARPSLPKLLGIPQAPGLLDILIDDSLEMSDVLLRTNVERLTILPSGTQHLRATELLASDAMNALLDEMAGRYSDRIIIFDSPPLLVTTEARVLASHMGQVVVVVQADHTRQSDVRQALATIEACPVKLMMLNKGRPEGDGGYYGYSSKGKGYGYGYGYGHSRESGA